MSTKKIARQCEQKKANIVWGYARVSTVKQDADRQERDILKHANAQGWTVKRFIASTVSSRRNEKERGLDVLKHAAASGEVNTVIFSELSRLGRSVGEICRLVNFFVEECLMTLVFVKEGMTLRPGVRDIQTKVVLTMFSLLAEIERDLISERTKSALSAKRAAGVKLGRPMGRSKLDARAEEIRQWLEMGVTKRAICRKVNCSEPTLYLWMKNQKNSTSSKTNGRSKPPR